MAATRAEAVAASAATWVLWVNHRLPDEDLYIKNLGDLCDGTRLIHLCKSLCSAKFLPLFPVTPTPEQRILNVETAWSMVQSHLNVTMSAAPGDIVEGNVSAIVSALWTLLRQFETPPPPAAALASAIDPAALLALVNEDLGEAAAIPGLTLPLSPLALHALMNARNPMLLPRRSTPASDEDLPILLSLAGHVYGVRADWHKDHAIWLQQWFSSRSRVVPGPDDGLASYPPANAPVPPPRAPLKPRRSSGILPALEMDDDVDDDGDDGNEDVQVDGGSNNDNGDESAVSKKCKVRVETKDGKDACTAGDGDGTLSTAPIPPPISPRHNKDRRAAFLAEIGRRGSGSKVSASSRDDEGVFRSSALAARYEGAPVAEHDFVMKQVDVEYVKDFETLRAGLVEDMQAAQQRNRESMQQQGLIQGNVQTLRNHKARVLDLAMQRRAVNDVESVEFFTQKKLAMKRVQLQLDDAVRRRDRAASALAVAAAAVESAERSRQEVWDRLQQRRSLEKEITEWEKEAPGVSAGPYLGTDGPVVTRHVRAVSLASDVSG